MTATYNPADPKYFDKEDLHAELDRVFDLCHGCRLCFNLCPSFPTLFDFIDEHDGEVEALTQKERDQVVDECFQCKICYVKCPYVPPHEWALDYPRLMMRVHANRKREGVSLKTKITDQALSRTDLVGALNSMLAPIVNASIATPGSLTRKAISATVGIASKRLLPPYARIRFSTWFKRRNNKIENPSAQASIFATCFVEYMATPIGQDLVAVCEKNTIECSLPEGAKCCGAPWLHSGNVDEFTKAAKENIAVLAKTVREGKDIVVPQPTCSYVIKKDYPLYVGGEDANLVSEHTFDAAEYLVRHHNEKGGLKTEFPGRSDGSVPDAVTYHVPCHLQAQNIGFKSRDLLKVADIRCDLVQRCSGIDGTWGLREDNYEMARKVARPMVRDIQAAGNEVICGDCSLANGAIEEETGTKPVHPVQILARAYGIKEGGNT
jgi:Fe-S oxidoreductase